MFKKLFLILTLAAPTLANATLEETREQIENLFFRAVDFKEYEKFFSTDVTMQPPRGYCTDSVKRIATFLVHAQKRYAAAYEEYRRHQSFSSRRANCEDFEQNNEQETANLKELFDTYAEQPPAIICPFVFQFWLFNNTPRMSAESQEAFEQKCIQECIDRIEMCTQIRQRNRLDGLDQTFLNLDMQVVRLGLVLKRGCAAFKDLAVVTQTTPDLSQDCHEQGRGW